MDLSQFRKKSMYSVQLQLYMLAMIKRKKNVMKTIENKKQRIKRFSWRFIWIKLGINVLRSKYDSIGTNFRVEMSIKYW